MNSKLKEAMETVDKELLDNHIKELLQNPVHCQNAAKLIDFFQKHNWNIMDSLDAMAVASFLASNFDQIKDFMQGQMLESADMGNIQ